MSRSPTTRVLTSNIRSYCIILSMREHTEAELSEIRLGQMEGVASDACSHACSRLFQQNREAAKSDSRIDPEKQTDETVGSMRTYLAALIERCKQSLSGGHGLADVDEVMMPGTNPAVVEFLVEGMAVEPEVQIMVGKGENASVWLPTRLPGLMITKRYPEGERSTYFQYAVTGKIPENLKKMFGEMRGELWFWDI